MEILSVEQMASKLARLENKPVLFLSRLDAFLLDNEIDDAVDDNGILRAFPFINIREDRNTDIWCDGQAIIICEDEEEQIRLYNLVYGDDGVTREMIKEREKIGYPVYKGKHRVYAMTINRQGEIETENT